MSPEQSEGKPALPASDQYSLGATLLTLISNGIPPHRVAIGSPALKAVAAKAMAASPVDRYPTVRDLGAEIERWLADEPVTVYTDPLPVRFRRGLRKHQTASIAAAVFLVASTIALAVGTFAVDRERRKTVQALSDRTDALANEVGDAFEALLSLLEVGGGAPDIGRLTDVGDAVGLVLEAEAFEGLAQLGFVLGDDVALLFVGDVDENLAFGDAIAEVGVDLVDTAFDFGTD
jgi:hypothetical protein